MAYRNLIDQHVHTDNSFDGHHNVMFICEKALENGLRGVSFTDHVEIDAKGAGAALRKITVPSYVETIKARGAFTGRLIVGAGVELGQAVYNTALAESITAGLQYDFVLGSIHNLEGMEDFFFLDYAQQDVQALLQQYFETLLTLARWGGFDSLAHLTYPLRYITGEQHIPVDLGAYDEIIATLFETLIAGDKALEINTSGLFQPLGQTLPQAQYLKLFRDLGGKYVTIGSDAHYADHVGRGCEAGMQMAYDCGFREIALFEHREPVLIPIV